MKPSAPTAPKAPPSAKAPVAKAPMPKALGFSNKKPPLTKKSTTPAAKAQRAAMEEFEGKAVVKPHTTDLKKELIEELIEKGKARQLFNL